jgi:DNA-binding FadR family transcriptional regulator
MFNSVRSNKISENIVEQIRKTIFEGTLKPGDKLSPEREFQEVLSSRKSKDDF